MPKRVLIHALGADMGGAVRHISNFLPALGRFDSKREYTVLIRPGIDLGALPINITVKSVPRFIAQSSFIRAIHDIVFLPIVLWKQRYDLVVTLTNFGLIWTSIPHIFFQRNSLYYCPRYLKAINGRLKLEVLLRRRLTVAMMKHANMIVTPSAAMAEMINSYFPALPHDRFRILYHGFDRQSMTEPPDPPLLEVINQAKGIKLIYPSHLSFYKGFLELFELLACAKLRGMHFTMLLTIDERDDRTLVDFYSKRLLELGLKADVLLIGRIPQGQMGSLYQLCDAMIFPSFCESFGFPLLEALAHGLPVIAADTSVNREICGNAAFYFSPENPVQGAEQLMNALSAPNKKVLRDHGRVRLTEFDWGWKRYACEFVRLIEEVS
jgi:glycosyltransferase involved in cell wall biosynthesis